MSDLDLEILDANGSPLIDANGERVGLSISFDNNYEIVDLDMRGYAQPMRVRVKGYPPFRCGRTVRSRLLPIPVG